MFHGMAAGVVGRHLTSPQGRLRRLGKAKACLGVHLRLRHRSASLQHVRGWTPGGSRGRCGATAGSPPWPGWPRHTPARGAAAPPAAGRWRKHPAGGLRGGEDATWWPPGLAGFCKPTPGIPAQGGSVLGPCACQHSQFYLENGHFGLFLHREVHQSTAQPKT